MRRWWTLLAKELREHALVLVLVALGLGAVELLLVLRTLGSPDTVTSYEMHATYVRFFLPAALMALGSRMVVGELYGKTQLFLEALPIRKYEPFVVKWALGAVYTTLVCLGGLALNVLVSLANESLDLRFVAILALRTWVFSIFVQTFFFSIGMTGKLRFVVYVVGTLGLTLYVQGTGRSIGEILPISLVGPSLTVERVAFPVAELATTLGLALAALATALALASVREGSVAETLAAPLSPRERTALGIGVVFSVVTLAAVDDSHEPAPYELQLPHMAHGRGAPLVLGTARDPQVVRLDLHRDFLERRVVDFARALGFEALPQLRVVDRPSLVAGEAVTLARWDGVLVRADLSVPIEQDAHIAQLLLRSLLEARTGRRASFEPQAFFQRGLASYFSTEPRGQLGDSDRTLARFAVQRARREGESFGHLLEHSAYIGEAAGESAVSSLSAVVVRDLVACADEARVIELARRRFGRVDPENSVVTVRELLEPFAASYERAIGQPFEGGPCMQRIEEELTRAEPIVEGLLQVRADLDLCASAGARDVAVAGSVAACSVRAHVDLGSFGVDDTTLRLLVHEVGTFDTTVSAGAPRQTTIAATAGENILTSSETFAPGTRLLVAVEVVRPSFGTARVAAERRVVRASEGAR